MTSAPMPFLSLDERMPERVALRLAGHVVIDDACRRPLTRVVTDALASTSALAHAWAGPEIHDASMTRIALSSAILLGLDI
jgi:hypothetical protein